MKVELLKCELAGFGGQRATIMLVAQNNKDRKVLQELQRVKLLKEPQTKKGELYSGQINLKGLDMETFLPPSMHQRTA